MFCVINLVEQNDVTFLPLVFLNFKFLLHICVLIIDAVNKKSFHPGGHQFFSSIYLNFLNKGGLGVIRSKLEYNFQDNSVNISDEKLKQS